MATGERQLTLQFVKEAYALISPYIVKTPLIANERLSELASTPLPSEDVAPKLRLFFKCENLQRGGAFKVNAGICKVKLTSNLQNLAPRRDPYATAAAGPAFFGADVSAAPSFTFTLTSRDKIGRAHV